MGAIIGKPLVFIPVLVAIVVLAVIYVPPLGQPTLRLGAERVTIVDLSASGATSSDGTRDLNIIPILGAMESRQPWTRFSATAPRRETRWNRTRG